MLGPPSHRVVPDESLKFVFFDANGAAAEAEASVLHATATKKPIYAGVSHLERCGNLLNSQQHGSVLTGFLVPIDVFFGKTDGTASDTHPDMPNLPGRYQTIYQGRRDTEYFGGLLDRQKLGDSIN
jgi:hypothetical protein